MPSLADRCSPEDLSISGEADFPAKIHAVGVLQVLEILHSVRAEKEAILAIITATSTLGKLNCFIFMNADSSMFSGMDL